jgi:hypothetical protein
MIAIDIHYEVDGQPVDPEALDDDYELAETLAHTGEQLRQQVAHKLDGIRCQEHDREPHVVITAAYTSDTGQMEISYHLDTCCQSLLLRAVQALNH